MSSPFERDLPHPTQFRGYINAMKSLNQLEKPAFKPIKLYLQTI